jgi:hypothetical protein
MNLAIYVAIIAGMNSTHVDGCSQCISTSQLATLSGFHSGWQPSFGIREYSSEAVPHWQEFVLQHARCGQ